MLRAGSVCPSFARSFRAAARAEGGFTLIELIVSMAILLVVLTAVTDALLSGASAEVAAESRTQVQVDARTALSRMRDDLHCAVAAPAVLQNDAGGFSLAITESSNGCKATSATSYVEWCTAVSPGSSTLSLYRSDQGSAPTTHCDTHSDFELTDIVPPKGGWPLSTVSQPACTVNCAGNLWPTPRACPTGHNFLATQAVAIAVNTNLAKSPDRDL